MRTNYLLTTLLVFFFQLSIAQVGIGTTSPDPSSELDISSPLNNKGVLIPRMIQADRNLIASPATGLLIYQTDNSPGFYYYNGTIWVGITAGASTDWTLLGNSGTTSATNFFGTTDDNDIVFKRNNIRAGFIGNPIGATPTTVNVKNTVFGANSLLNPATGYRNTAIGSNVLPSNSTGRINVAIGDAAMFSNTTGAENVAVGAGALYSNTLGYANVALGRNALTNLNGTSGTEGVNNTAVGYEAIRQSTTGQDNTAIGREALRSNSTGNSNVAIGYQSGLNNTGSNNITIGANSEVPVLANSDQLSIGNVIYGKNMTSTFNGLIGIGENDPIAKLHVNTGGPDLYGIYNEYLPNTNTSFLRAGFTNSVIGNTTDAIFGTYNSVSNNGTGAVTGWANQIVGVSGNTFLTGNNTVITGESNTIGNNNFLTNNNTTDPTMGMYSYSSNLAGTSNGIIRGTDTTIGVSGTGNHYGNYNLLNGNGNTVGGSSHYGNYNLLNGTGTTNKYGSYNRINTTAGGTHYGVYSEVLKAGATNFAGYFLGNVGIGTTVANTYTLPASRATTAGQIMQTNATGVVTWQTPAAALNSSAWLTTGNTSVAADFLGTNNAFPLRFVTSGTERMRISATGNIGINTLTPSGTDRINIVTGTGMNGILLTSQQTTSGSYGFRNTATFSSGNANVYTGYNGTITTAGGTATNAGLFSDITTGGSTSIVGSTSGTATSASIIGTSTVWNGVNARTSAVTANALVGVNAAAAGTSTGNGIFAQTSQRSGVALYGFNNNATAGTDFDYGFSKISVFGDGLTAGSYTFAVYGDAGLSTRSGAVFGNDFGTRGSLGYFASTLIDYAVYGFGLAYQTGGVGGRPGSAVVANQPNNMVGLGIYGGVMGDWVRGMNYGFHAKGKEYGMYVDGNTITNKPVVQLIENGKEKRSVSYSTTSMSVDVYTRGTSSLVNGSTYISFKEDFSSITSKEIPLNITITPTGASKGVYVTDISNEGFRIVENGDGRSNVSVNWVAYGTRIGYENPEEIVSEEILSSKFDENMDAVMYNDNNTDGQQKGIWFDGNKVQTGRTPDSFQQAKLAKGQNKKRPSTEAVKTQEQK